MGLYQFRLPDIGEGVAEAEIATWHVKPGDLITEDQSIVDVMTDKATVDMSSPVSGRVLSITGEPGSFIAVGAVLVEIEVEGTGNVSGLVTEAKPQIEPESVSVPTSGAAPVTATPVVTEAPLASPSTRRKAREQGIDLAQVQGSGRGGRITPDDFDAFVAAKDKGQSQGSGLSLRPGIQETKIIGLRRKIAEKMEAAKRRIPHFAYVEAFDVTELEALRLEMNAERRDGQSKLTLLPFFMRAVVKLQGEFPTINARYDDEAGLLRTYDGVHIGIATQTDSGLMVPVVRHAEARDLWDCAKEMGRVTKAARDGSASRDELSGSTLTLTSLGTLGGIAATPVINAPEVAIIGPNKMVDTPVVRDGQVVIRKMMNVSSSFDHRIIDGYMAASFIQRLKRLIERPALIFVD